MKKTHTYTPDGQLEQTVDVVALLVVEYRPAEQLLQLDEPEVA